MEVQERIFVAAIGSSAGGLDALERFFQKAPHNNRVAYIVIQHLSPDFESLMDQLLSRKTDIQIRVIEDGMKVHADHIYLLPPGKEAIITQGALFLKDRSPARELTFPIDEFFRSLAQDVGEHSIGIVLSGTGTDGSRGIQDIHAAGGLVVSQDENSAAFDGMPRSACGTGVVDLVLSPEAIPGALLEYMRNPEMIRSRLQPSVPKSASLDYMDVSMRRILNLLNARFGLDFTHYKAPTIARRIERRLTLSGLDLQEYSEALQKNSDLVEELYFDLLIGVTGFFRDREVFERLELDVIPSLIARLGPQEEFRVWVAGSATGEEAYSIAILLIECFEAVERPCNARIFASDVHERSLTRASQGVYPPDRVAGILPHRLERFFEERPEGYRITAEIRKLVVFTPHNVIHDAPFTRLDLVTCRNVLIYFNQATQQKALSLLSFGLKNGGALCLGASETPGEMRDEFVAIDKTSRIFRKHRESQFPKTPFKPPALRSALTNAIRHADGNARSTAGLNELNPNSLLSTYDRVLSDFMPPGLLITRSRQLVHAFEGASKYLVPRDGRPSSDVSDYIAPSLKPAMSAAIRRVGRDKTPVSYPGIEVETKDGIESIRLVVTPYVNDVDIEHFLVLFECEEKKKKPAAQLLAAPVPSEEIEALDRELQITRENLQASIQELQATNEQHQSANEELTAANEELQSTNEELHSVNEELYTVNAEHQRKIDELTELTDDMDNLLTTTNVHTLFLDGELRLRRFTPRIAEFFNLIPQDIGRRIESFTNNLVDDDLVDEVRSVLQTENSFEREIKDHTNCWYLLRIFPYLSRGKVEGAVLTLVDITSMKQASEALRRSEQRFNLAVRGSNEGIWDWQDVSQEYIWCSERFYSLLGYVDEKFEMTYSLWSDLFHPDDRERVMTAIEEHLKSGKAFDVECRIERQDGSFGWFHCCGAAERTSKGTAKRMAGSLEDITDRRRAQDDVRVAVLRRDQFLAMLSHELRNPLGAILNAVQLLNNVANNSPALDVVSRQSRQMARLLDDLLDVSRIAHGKLELVREPVDVVGIVEAALQIIPSDTQVEMQLSVELPQERLIVNGDPARLEQVLVNLIVNAFKYTPEGGDIAVNMSKEGAEVMIEVCDSGVGIAPEMIDSIFQLFVQSDETIDRSNGGMGVGLTLVKSVIEMHGGQVEAHSAGLGQGSCFKVRLPLVDHSVTINQQEVSGNGAVQRLVIVEDIDDARQMLQLLLEGQGYTVSSAADGLSGLALVVKERPDVAFIDIGLPGIDGFEVARRVRKDPNLNSTRLVALTGYGQASDREAVTQAGFDNHLVKPLKPEDLARALHPRVESDVLR